MPTGYAIRKAGCGAVSQWDGAWEPRGLRGQDDKKRREPRTSPRYLGLPTVETSRITRGP